VSTSTSSLVPALPSTTGALRSIPRRFARFISEPLDALLDSSCVTPDGFRAS
jgi:hypothetical protein